QRARGRGDHQLEMATERRLQRIQVNVRSAEDQQLWSRITHESFAARCSPAPRSPPGGSLATPTRSTRIGTSVPYSASPFGPTMPADAPAGPERPIRSLQNLPGTLSPVLDLRDVHKRFGDIHAVRGVTLRVE